MEGMKVLHPKPGAFFMGIKPLSKDGSYSVLVKIDYTEGEIGRMG